MSDVIDFKTKTPMQTPTQESISLINFIEQVLKEGTAIEALMVCIKYVDDEVEMYRTDNFNIKDRSFMLQLLQSDISEELAPNANIELEPNL